MYEIHFKGKKIAVLLGWTNLLGYGEADIIHEEETQNDNFILHCEISTKYDESPFGTEEKDWDGETADIAQYTEDDIRSGKHYMCFEQSNIKYLSGFLNLEIEMLNRPDDNANPRCEFLHYLAGECIESSDFYNPDCEMDWEEMGFSPEEIEEMKSECDDWHEFSI